jgi:Tol biopolymer transport system component
LSADGSVLAYDTGVAIDSGDTNGASDVYVLDRTTRRTTLVSVSSTGALGNGVSFRPAVSPNGQFVAFLSVASNLVPADTNDCDDVFVHSRLTGVTFRTNRTSTGGQATSGITTLGGEPIGITTDAADETLVAFTSSAALVPEDRDGTDDDVYLRGP